MAEIKPLNLSQYAALRGCSVEAVRKAIKSGRLEKAVVYVEGSSKPKINPIIAQEEWATNTDTSYISNGKDAPAPVRMTFEDLKHDTPPPSVMPAAGPTNKRKAPPSPGESKDEKTSKALKEFYGAKMVQLEFEERSGKLISAEKAQSDAFKIARMVRDRLMAIPARLSAELVGQNDQKTIAKKLDQELRRALESLADETEALQSQDDAAPAPSSIDMALAHV